MCVCFLVILICVKFFWFLFILVYFSFLLWLPLSLFYFIILIFFLLINVVLIQEFVLWCFLSTGHRQDLLCFLCSTTKIFQISGSSYAMRCCLTLGTLVTRVQSLPMITIRYCRCFVLLFLTCFFSWLSFFRKVALTRCFFLLSFLL